MIYKHYYYSSDVRLLWLMNRLKLNFFSVWAVNCSDWIIESLSWTWEWIIQNVFWTWTKDSIQTIFFLLFVCFALFCNKEEFSLIFRVKFFRFSRLWSKLSYGFRRITFIFMLLFCHFEAWQSSFTFITKHNIPILFFNIYCFLFQGRKKSTQVS